jgi:hypothetical protein
MNFLIGNLKATNLLEGKVNGENPLLLNYITKKSFQ